jgi:AraC-like DNA-binding protein
LRITNEFPNPASVDYVERVNRALDYIVQGLGRSLHLKEVARVAGFSPFHFHRVF